jgi:hypothetical protein
MMKSTWAFVFGILLFVSSPSIEACAQVERSSNMPPSSGTGTGFGREIFENSGPYLDSSQSSGSSGSGTGATPSSGPTGAPPTAFGHQCITDTGRCSTAKMEPLGSECACFNFDDRTSVKGKVRK